MEVVFLIFCLEQKKKASGQFYIVGAPSDMLSAGAQRSIAPRANVQVNRESHASRATGNGNGEPVCTEQAKNS